MRTRTHGILILTVLLVLSTAGVRAQQVPRDNAPELRMYPLKYCPADQLYRILQNVIDGPNVRLAIDDRSNVLLVTAPRQQLERIDGIVSKLDVPTERGAETPQMMYRVYMVELPSKVEAMKPFSLVAANSSNLSAADIVQAAENTKIRLTNLDIAFDQDAESGMWTWRCAIDGLAASPEAIQRLKEQMPGSEIRQLRWENETTAIPAAQVAPLPSQIAQQIHRLLGAEVQTVGYWFGNVSLPGEVTAPLGAWKLSLEVETALRDELQLGISVTEEVQRGDSLQVMEILSNRIQAKVGKPIIIGYNRDRHGARTMGALVIVGEEDTPPVAVP